MNSREKKAWLAQYGLIEGRVRRLMGEREEWDERRRRITSGSGERMRGSKRGDGAGAALSAIDGIERDIGRETAELRRLRERILAAIDTVGDPVQRELLTLRYLRGWRWQDIADELGYEYSYTTRLHGRALEALRVKARGPVTKRQDKQEKA